jgi:hypothetical protein
MDNLPSNGTPERLVIERLFDLANHSSLDLLEIGGGKAPRDIIQKLRRKYKYNIFTESSGWRLDERHLSGDEKLVRIARAESSYIHAEHSLKQVNREKKREDKAIKRKLETAEALQKEKAE